MPLEENLRAELPGTEVSYLDVIFGVMVLLASTFSAYTSYLGYSHDIPPFLAAVLALLIGLGLVATNFKIRECRLRRRPLWPPLLAFGMIFLFSFISNANAIYTYFVRNHIVADTMERAWAIFEAETEKVIAAVAKAPDIAVLQERQVALEAELLKLEAQIRDPRNPGRGQLANEHLAEISRLIGVQITSLKPPSLAAPEDQWDRYVKQLKAQISEVAKLQFTKEPAWPLVRLQERTRELQQGYAQEVAEGRYAAGTTDTMARDLESISSQARTLLAPPRPYVGSTPERTASDRSSARCATSGVWLTRPR